MSLPRRNLFIEAALKNIEELGHFPSEEARRRAINHHVKVASRPRDLAVGIIILAVATAAAYAFFRFLVPHVLPNSTPRFVREITTFAGAISVYALTLRALHRAGAASEMRTLLLKENIPVCLSCGYLLRGLPASTATCPECGRPLSPEVSAILAAEAPGTP